MTTRPVPDLPRVTIDDTATVYLDGDVVKPVSSSLAPGETLRVKLLGKTYRVQTLVCAAWHGPRPSNTHRATLLNGDPDDLAPANLAWLTQTEAAERQRVRRRANEHQSDPSAPNDPSLAPDELETLRELTAMGFTPHDLAGHLFSHSAPDGTLLEDRSLTEDQVQQLLGEPNR